MTAKGWAGTLRVAAALASLVVPGCATSDLQDAVHVQALAGNSTDHDALLVLKVWDHDGALAFNTTVTLAAGASSQKVGDVGGAMPTYGSSYSWFAQAGARQQQVSRSPVGTHTWAVQVKADRIEFAFS